MVRLSRLLCLLPTDWNCSGSTGRRCWRSRRGASSRSGGSCRSSHAPGPSRSSRARSGRGRAFTAGRQSHAAVPRGECVRPLMVCCVSSGHDSAGQRNGGGGSSHGCQHRRGANAVSAWTGSSASNGERSATPRYTAQPTFVTAGASKLLS